MSQFYPYQPIQFMDGLLDPPIGFGDSGGAFHTYRSSPYSSADATTYSGGVFNGISIGSNPNGCLVVVLIAGVSSFTGRTISSGTIGGSAAAVTSGASSTTSRGVMSRRIASGTTTVDIAITFSSSMTRCVAHVFTIEGPLASDTVHHTVDTASTTALSDSFNLNIPANGVAFAQLFYSETSDDAITWSGLTETSEGYDATETVNYGTAANSSMASETGRTITWTRGLNSFTAYAFGASWG